MLRVAPRGWERTVFLVQQGWELFRQIKGIRGRRAYFYKARHVCPVMDHGVRCAERHGRYRPGMGTVSAMCCISLNRVLDLIVHTRWYHTVYLLGFDGLGGGHFHDDTRLYPSGVAASIQPRTKAAETAAMRKAAPKPIGRNDDGNERMQATFAMFNGLRLINLAERSKFGSVVQTQTIDQMIQDLATLE
eukprot:TRINITY_DN51486_c0_g1_i2.p1 TRINITY_DN51486_c0_g1~~TRINITY_DN51486_c0_g1_i2.p1  ORF type:complete len:190 (-),score=31.81 TRINITY_DN51486_c0_g1_i2:242-811(-)